MKRRTKAILAGIKRIGLRNENFTIISNNCWGGLVYDEYHLPYLSPTIGMWFPSEDYMKFVLNLEHYLACDLYRIGYKDCHARKLLVARKAAGRYRFDLDDMVIGRLDDVDIIFLHYHSFDDARAKWYRRRTRVNFDNLIVKFNDQNGFKNEYFETFSNLGFEHKLFFTVDKKFIQNDWCFLYSKKDDDGNVDDTVIGAQPFSIKRLLNSMT